MPNFKTKALAVRKLKGNENCENEHREKASFMYNFVQKTNAHSDSRTPYEVLLNKFLWPMC